MTHPSYRWTLQEYVLRCALYAEVRELLVEGELDAACYSDLLERGGMTEVTVRDADYIHVTSDEIREAGFATGAKGRLLTVAVELQRHDAAEPLRGTVVIVVDRDYDGVPDELSDVVLQTDGYSLESYAIERPSMARFIRDFLGRGPQPAGASGARRRIRVPLTATDLLERVLPAAIEAAVARRIVRSIDPQIGLIDRWTDYFALDRDGIFTERTAELIEVSLIAGGRRESLEDEAVTAERTAARDDPVLLVRGHDFVCLLHKLLASPWGRRVTPVRFDSVDEHHVRRWFVMSIHPSTLDRSPLAQQLHDRFATPLSAA